MYLKTNAILAALALAITNISHAGPGSRDPGVIQPRPIITREVTMACPRCQQPIRTTAQRTAKPANKYVAASATVAARKVM